MAISAPVPIERAYPSTKRSVPVAASTKIYRGSLCARNASGYLVEHAASSLVDACIALEEVDNSSGSDGDLSCECDTGVFALTNDTAGGAITEAEVGDVCYGKDGATVSKTSTSRSVAGVVVGFEGTKVLVAVGTWPLQVGLLAANNLTDIGSAATARSSIGANVGTLTFTATDLVGADATRYLLQAPRDLTITEIRSTLCGHALATGNATLTAKIAGTAVTTGVVTITQAGSAIGDKDSATPTALNTASADDLIEILVGGTNDDTSAFAIVQIDYTF